MRFVDRLLQVSRERQSLLCVGLDPDPELMPAVPLEAFQQAIIDATWDLVCAFKPNLAFYEAQGLDGLKALYKVVDAVAGRALVIGDAKRGDIGSTSRAYARAAFESLGLDALTVNPYLGHDSVAPFLEYGDRGIFILCRTSNPGSQDFQEALVGGRPLLELVAQKAVEWDRKGNVGLVVGATFPRDVGRVRQLCPDLPFLIPGVGAQGGDLEQAVRHGVDRNGEKAIISASRQVLYASRGADFAEAARGVAARLRDEINRARGGPATWSLR